MWHRIASRIGCSVREAKRKINHNEFLRWEIFLNDEYNVHSQESWHLARVVQELNLIKWTIANMFSAGAREPETDIKDYLVKFKQQVVDPDDLPDSDDPAPVSVTIPPDRLARMKLSKGSWLVVAGILGNKTGKFKTKKPPPKPPKE